MAILDLEQLFTIAENSIFLDSVEKALRDQGHNTEANALNKLQQDVGVAIEREMNGYDENQPAPGPETARLNAAYEPVTFERLDILTQTHQLLSGGVLKNKTVNLIEKLSIPLAPPVIAPNNKTPKI